MINRDKVTPYRSASELHKPGKHLKHRLTSGFALLSVTNSFKQIFSNSHPSHTQIPSVNNEVT